MKIIIVGSGDTLGAELVRQALANPTITSVVAIAPDQTDPLPYHHDDPKLISLILPLDVQGMSKANNETFGSSACICSDEEMHPSRFFLEILTDVPKERWTKNEGMEK
ncbi:hypothetical protein ACHAPF_007103 [Botrytis cinerea]